MRCRRGKHVQDGSVGLSRPWRNDLETSGVAKAWRSDTLIPEMSFREMESSAIKVYDWMRPRYAPGYSHKVPGHPECFWMSVVWLTAPRRVG
jgi:hypothetical protein